MQKLFCIGFNLVFNRKTPNSRMCNIRLSKIAGCAAAFPSWDVLPPQPPFPVTFAFDVLCYPACVFLV